MSQNTAPIFPKTPSLQWAPALTAANTTRDGTGTVATVFTANALNGSRVDYLKVRALGTNVATVLRVFINNGLTNATAANNTLFMERSLLATTISETVEQADVIVPLDISLDPGFVINVTLGTAVAAGHKVTAVAGGY